MGGEIGVESELGVGSTFFFEIPFEKQPEDARTAVEKIRGDLRGLRVLIVDDNATNRQILAGQTARWGMYSESAENAAEALRLLRAAAGRGEPFDLAILDMQMPEMDGMELAGAVKRDPALSSTRLVLLTSIGRRGDGEAAQQAGVGAYLTKPVRQSELYDALATVMDVPARDEEAPLITRHSLREQRSAAETRLLLAEDNPVNQKVAIRMIESLGYRVDVAANGRETVEAVSRNANYAAVLMDVQMPVMDGYEATAEIRALEDESNRRNTRGNGTHHIPIIAMTANAMQGDREKVLEAGMDDYLPKPVRPEQLAAVLERWTRNPELGEHVPAPALPDRMTLDRSAIEGLRELQEEGEPDLLSELVDLFLEEIPERLKKLRDAAGSDDAEGVERAAHAIRGSAGNMGARRMSELCGGLQKAGASKDLSGALRLIEELEDEFTRVRSALEAELRRTDEQ